MTADDKLLKDYFIAEFNTLREEILDRLRLRTQYELIAYTLFMGLFGITFYVGYPIFISQLLHCFPVFS